MSKTTGAPKGAAPSWAGRPGLGMRLKRPKSLLWPPPSEVFNSIVPTWALSGQLSPDSLVSNGETRSVEFEYAAGGHHRGIDDQPRRHLDMEVVQVAVGERVAWLSFEGSSLVEVE